MSRSFVRHSFKVNLIDHSVYIYFYGNVNVDSGDKVIFYAYPIRYEKIF